MKPLKTENEIDPSMKSTFKYTFIMPAAIGKGRGRGLKSLGKDRGGLKNSALCTSQGKGTIHKNSMDLEKEDMQMNAPALPFESFIGKGRGKGLNYSTLSTGQGMKMIYKNSMASEYEVGSLNKSAFNANHHMQTPSKSTRSTSTKSFSPEMQKMDKLILEKEDILNNHLLPPSIDHVMEHSQTFEKGFSNPTKVKRVRGSKKCKEVSSLEVGQKLKVTFYNNRTVGTNSKLFSRHLGKIVRDCNICPLGVSSWNEIKEEKLNHMWAAVEHKFEADDMNNHCEHILGWMNELWNKWRGHLHAKYVKDKPMHQSLKNIPSKKQQECTVPI